MLSSRCDVGDDESSGSFTVSTSFLARLHSSLSRYSMANWPRDSEVTVTMINPRLNVIATSMYNNLSNVTIQYSVDLHNARAKRDRRVHAKGDQFLLMAYVRARSKRQRNAVNIEATMKCQAESSRSEGNRTCSPKSAIWRWSVQPSICMLLCVLRTRPTLTESGRDKNESAPQSPLRPRTPVSRMYYSRFTGGSNL